MYKVIIRNNETGEVRTAEMDLPWDESSMFWWTEGNYGCDCNRGATFQRAGGVLEDDIDWECGHARYAVLYVDLEGGERLAVDGPEPERFNCKACGREFVKEIPHEIIVHSTVLLHLAWSNGYCSLSCFKGYASAYVETADLEWPDTLP